MHGSKIIKDALNMSDDAFRIFKDDFALIIESGFIAVKQLDETSATRLFRAAAALNPTSTAPLIGLAYICLNKLEVKEATDQFQKIVEQEPENELAHTFLAICFLLNKSKRKKGEKIIHEILTKTSNPTIKNLGQVSLEWADKDLKKKNVPFFGAKPDEDDEKKPENDETTFSG